MKAFLLSLLALSLLLVCIILNSVYVSYISAQMRVKVNELKISPSIGKLEEIEDIWDKHKIFISISVPHKHTDELEKEFLVLRARFDSNEEIKESTELVLRAISEIETHGTISLDNVL